MNKYNNKKCEYNGHKFDSKLEMEYFKYLLARKDVIDIHLQPVFELQEGYKKNGRKILPIKYVADFLVTYSDNRREVIDVKGMVLNDFKLKMKIFEYKYDYTLKLVTYSKIDGGWIELDELKKRRRERKKSKK